MNSISLECPNYGCKRVRSKNQKVCTQCYIDRRIASGLNPKCQIDGCQRPSRSRGCCPMHYKRFKMHGDANYNRTKYICLACGNKHYAKSLCKKHYNYFLTHKKRYRAKFDNVVELLMALPVNKRLRAANGVTF